jgi:hypothetical protein
MVCVEYWLRYRRSPQISLWMIEDDGHHLPAWVSYIVLPRER